MHSTNPKVSSKEKLKSKPKIGAGSKEEKRKMKKEKLAEALQKKVESNEKEVQPTKRVIPVTFDQDFYDSLKSVIDTDVSTLVPQPTKKQKALNAVDKMKRLLANSNFSNPDTVFNEVDAIIDRKTTYLQQKIADEEQRKFEKEQREKQQNSQ